MNQLRSSRLPLLRIQPGPSTRYLRAAAIKPQVNRLSYLSTSFQTPQTQAHIQRRSMSTNRDVSKWSDISKSTFEADGSFKRKPSSFRDFIQKGGKFEPEKGMTVEVSAQFMRS